MAPDPAPGRADPCSRRRPSRTCPERRRWSPRRSRHHRRRPHPASRGCRAAPRARSCRARCRRGGRPDGRLDVVAIRIGREGRLVPGRVLPGAVEVVGHQVEEVDMRPPARPLECGDLVGSRRGGDRELVRPAEPGPRASTFAANVRHEQGVVGPVVRAHGIARLAASARILPVEVDPVEHPVGVEESRRSSRAIVSRPASVAATVLKWSESVQPPMAIAHLEMRILLLELGELGEVAPHRLLGPGIARRVVPLIGLAADALVGREPLLDRGIGVVDGDLASWLQVEERVDQMRELLGRHVGHLEVAAVDAPLGEVGRQHLVVGGDRQGRGIAGIGRGRVDRHRIDGGGDRPASPSPGARPGLARAAVPDRRERDRRAPDRSAPRRPGRQAADRRGACRDRHRGRACSGCRSRRRRR